MYGIENNRRASFMRNGQHPIFWKNNRTSLKLAVRQLVHILPSLELHPDSMMVAVHLL